MKAPLDSYRCKARERLLPLRGRPALVMQNGSTAGIERYLGDMKNVAAFTLLDVPIDMLFPEILNGFIVHPHTDKWLFIESAAKTRVDTWLSNALIR